MQQYIVYKHLGLHIIDRYRFRIQKNLHLFVNSFWTFWDYFFGLSSPQLEKSAPFD